MTKKREKYAGAIAQLQDYVDKVLDAFQGGSGIRDGAPEPITLDIARRMIWDELRRVIFGLLEGKQACLLEMRISGGSTDEILAALLDVKAHLRVLGPRREGDLSVVYATVPVNKTWEAYNIYRKLTQAGLHIRDLSVGFRL